MAESTYPNPTTPGKQTPPVSASDIGAQAGELSMALANLADSRRALDDYGLAYLLESLSKRAQELAEVACD